MTSTVEQLSKEQVSMDQNIISTLEQLSMISTMPPEAFDSVEVPGQLDDSSLEIAGTSASEKDQHLDTSYCDVNLLVDALDVAVQKNCGGQGA
jgi:hypothetical protein